MLTDWTRYKGVRFFFLIEVYSSVTVYLLTVELHVNFCMLFVWSTHWCSWGTNSFKRKLCCCCWSFIPPFNCLWLSGSSFLQAACNIGTSKAHWGYRYKARKSPEIEIQYKMPYSWAKIKQYMQVFRAAGLTISFCTSFLGLSSAKMLHGGARTEHFSGL